MIAFTEYGKAKNKNGEIIGILLTDCLPKEEGMLYQVSYLGQGSQGHLVIKIFEQGLDICSETVCLQNILDDDFFTAVANGFKICDITSDITISIRPSELTIEGNDFAAYEQVHGTA